MISNGFLLRSIPVCHLLLTYTRNLTPSYFHCLGAADTVSLNYYIQTWQLTLPRQTVSAIYAFFLAMVLHPDVASKAQQEIEAVVGTERLPNFADREHLPYVSALTKEVLRWNSVVPLGWLYYLAFTSAPF